MAKEVYIAGVGLSQVDLTDIFGSIFDLFGEAYRNALRFSDPLVRRHADRHGQRGVENR